MPCCLIGSLTCGEVSAMCTDLESHADSPLVRRNALIYENLETTVEIKGFTTTLGSATVPVVNAAVAYDDIYNNNCYNFTYL